MSKIWRRCLRPSVLLASALVLCAGAALAQSSPATEDEFIEKARTDVTQRGIPFTPELETRLRTQYRQMQALRGLASGRPGAGQAFAGAAPVAAVAPATGLTTAALAAQIEQFPAPAWAEVTARKDGFDLNGSRVMDPEGRITRFIASPRTGDYTYMIDRADGSKLIKRGRGAGGAIALATVRGTPGNWSLQFVDGQNLQADSLTLTPLGVLGARDSSVFELVAGKPIKGYTLPDGWSPVPLQRGDVSFTRHVLLERNADSRPQTGSFAALIQATKRLTGAETPDDYALLNLDSGQLVKLALDVIGKNVTRMSDCRRKNAVVNVCDRAESYESLWTPEGARNTSHYFWRVNWLDTPQGPMAMSLQQSVKEVRLFDLKSGKEVVAFRRGLGIAGWSSVQTRDGRVHIDAQLGFKSYTLDDARKLLDEGADVRGKDLEGTIIAGQAESSEPQPPASVPGNPAGSGQ